MDFHHHAFSLEGRHIDAHIAARPMALRHTTKQKKKWGRKTAPLHDAPQHQRQLRSAPVMSTDDDTDGTRSSPLLLTMNSM